jgi:hypothetical protein
MLERNYRSELPHNVRPRSCRQFEPGAEAAAFAGGEDDVPAVLAGNRASDSETETDAAGVGVARTRDAIERFEHLIALAAGNPRPAILDGEDDAPPAVGGQSRLCAAAILNGVIDQVGDGAAQRYGAG